MHILIVDAPPPIVSPLDFLQQPFPPPPIKQRHVRPHDRALWHTTLRFFRIFTVIRVCCSQRTLYIPYCTTFEMKCRNNTPPFECTSLQPPLPMSAPAATSQSRHKTHSRSRRHGFRVDIVQPLLGPSWWPTGTPPRRRGGGALLQAWMGWCARRGHTAGGGRTAHAGLAGAQPGASLRRGAAR